MKKSFIKFAALALAACMGVGVLASCGTAPEETEKSTGADQTDSVKTVEQEQSEATNTADGTDIKE